MDSRSAKKVPRKYSWFFSIPTWYLGQFEIHLHPCRLHVRLILNI